MNPRSVSMRSAAIVAILGVFLGANLTEGCVLVPYWQSLPAGDFFAWYAANDSRLFGFFGAVTAIVTLAVVAEALISLRRRDAERWYAVVAAGLIVAVVLMFPLYFAAANASFATGSLGAADLPAALTRWATWHWVRTVLVGAALLASMLSMRSKLAGA